LSVTSPAANRSLAFASFAALWWVVVNQFRDHLGLELGARSGLVAKGYLGADLFLVIWVSSCAERGSAEPRASP
jgi:hypothetical protein